MNTEPQAGTPRKRWPWGAILLLAVIGVVVLGLFWPPCCLSPGSSIRAVRTASTQRTIMNLSAGIEAFKADWGVYPPSSTPGDEAKRSGAENLKYYLMGPQGNGWGKPANGATPIGGKSEATYGPYFRQDSSTTEDGITDSFRPAKLILYFRFDRDRDPPYDVRDNPVGTSYAKGFASQEQLELLVRPKDASGNRKWVREDYLLISSGPDRYYGFVVEDKATGEVRPARPEEVEAGEATCDDVTNFKH
ncbi:MAG: hypothetical protein NT049_01770 [Planctomycetota bacterium]|nr:hypothetical protein [Planctomycetota bacterium]